MAVLQKMWLSRGNQLDEQHGLVMGRIALGVIQMEFGFSSKPLSLLETSQNLTEPL